VPHLSSDTRDVIDEKVIEEVTTVVTDDTGNKFAYDTINNNEEFDFAHGNNVTILGEQKSNNEVVEHSSPEPKANIINKNNEKQEPTTSFDVIKNQSHMEGSSNEHISNSSSSSDVDIKSNSQTGSLIGSKNEAKNTSTEKSSNDFEIQRFISEHIKFKSNNVTIKKSWSKWNSWSTCSRSCGEGVMSQSRECIEKT
jgi:hypothetical protein